MITAKEANYIAKYDNPQKELIDIVVEQLIDYIDERTIKDAQKGDFRDSMIISQDILSLYHVKVPEKLSERSIREVIQEIACILEEHGYNIYYEDNYIQWSWKLDNEE